MESPEALLLAMRPWLRVLEHTTEISGIFPDASKPLHARLLTEDRTVDYRTFEALELLALLSEIDYDAWKQAMHLTWPEYAIHAIDLSIDRALPLGCELHLLHQHEQIHLDEWLKRVIVGRSEFQDSPGYIDLRRRLEATYFLREHDTRSFQPKPVPRDQLVIHVGLLLSSSTYMDNLRKMIQITSVEQATWIASAAKNEEFKPLFRVKRLTPGFPDDDILSVEAMLYMVQIVKYGGTLNRLSIFEVETSEPGLLATGLQVLMGCSTKSAELPGEPERGAVTAVEMCRLLDRRTIAAAYSALATSQTVERVFLYCAPVIDTTRGIASAVPFDDRRYHWHWIAYAIFSRHAGHRISDVHISTENIRMQDIAYVEEFLQHPNPLTLLWEEKAASKIPTTEEFATACRFQLSPPPTDTTARRQPGCVFARQQVRILPSGSTAKDPTNSEFERVMLAGFGPALVARNDIEDRVPISEPLPLALTTLVIHDMSHEGKTAILALLRLVGHNFTKLELMGVKGTEPLDEWVLSVFKVCSRLLKFKMHGGVLRSLNTLAEAYERGVSRVQDIWISDIHVIESPQAPAFFLKLADRNHPMTKSLRQLDIDYDDASGSPRALSEACRVVLDANFDLVMFKLRVYYSIQDQEENRSLLNIHENETTPIHHQRVPLNLYAKLAFLSVVVGGDVKSQAMQAVDASVLSTVFQFAAQCHKRSVHVTFKNPDDRWNFGAEDEDDEGEEADAEA